MLRQSHVDLWLGKTILRSFELLFLQLHHWLGCSGNSFIDETFHGWQLLGTWQTDADLPVRQDTGPVFRKWFGKPPLLQTWEMTLHIFASVCLLFEWFDIQFMNLSGNNTIKVTTVTCNSRANWHKVSLCLRALCFTDLVAWDVSALSARWRCINDSTSIVHGEDIWNNYKSSTHMVYFQNWWYAEFAILSFLLQNVIVGQSTPASNLKRRHGLQQCNIYQHIMIKSRRHINWYSQVATCANSRHSLPLDNLSSSDIHWEQQSTNERSTSQ